MILLYPNGDCTGIWIYRANNWKAFRFSIQNQYVDVWMYEQEGGNPDHSEQRDISAAIGKGLVLAAWCHTFISCCAGQSSILRQFVRVTTHVSVLCPTESSQTISQTREGFVVGLILTGVLWIQYRSCLPTLPCSPLQVLNKTSIGSMEILKQFNEQRQEHKENPRHRHESRYEVHKTKH